MISAKFILFSILVRPLLKHLGLNYTGKSNKPTSASTNSANSLLKIFSNYLASSGWVESQNSGMPTRDGLALPWLTYPAIELLEKLNLKSSLVVEIGSGASTIYWSRKSKHVTSYEFDSSWYEKLLSELQGNRAVSLHLIKTNEINRNAIDSYHLEVSHQIGVFIEEPASSEVLKQELMEISRCGDFVESLISSLRTANVVLIDGNFRNICLFMAGIYCKGDSIIILDNSERDDYKAGRNALESQGYTEIPFCGLGPINPYSWTTSVYLKSLSSLDYQK